MKTILTALLLLSASFSANAVLIASDNTAITSTGQSYSQSFSVTPTTYSNVVLSLDIWGDFGQTQANEHHQFFIDGTLLADLHANDNTSTIIGTTDQPCCSWHFVGDIAIDDAVFNSFASDGTLDISWVNGSGVNVIASQNYVSWEIAAVPVPAAVWLFGSGLLGLIGMRKKSA